MSDLQSFLLPNAPTCIVACSGSSARLWKSVSRFGAWDTLAEMQHPESDQRDAELVSDRPGRSFDSFGSGRHAMSTRQSEHEHELGRFADEVAGYLNNGLVVGQFENIVLLADPRFLGLLRSRLSSAATAAVVMAAPKNIVNLDVNAIREYFT